MFEGSSVSEQLHQFLTPRTTPPPPNSSSLPLPLPLNFALHSPNFNFLPNFDSYNTTSIHLLHPSLNIPHQNGNHKDDETATATTNATGTLQVGMDLEVGRESNSNHRSILMEDHHHNHQWSNDELLALLRIRSNIDNCFPESTWEHVSRKLGEVGFRRTAEKCKEKFEEESRYFNHINYNKSCRFLPHDQLNYHHQPHQDPLLLIHGGDGKPDDSGPSVVAVVEVENKANFEDRDEEQEEEVSKTETRATKQEAQNKNNNDEKKEKSGEAELEESSSRSISCKKRKRKMMMRQKEFEMLKGYCEEIVKKMMVQQEEIHSKLLHDMLKREEEKVAKEECWKKQQMERLHKELEVMAHEQAIASDRQTTIIEILNQITNSTTFSSFQSKKDLQNLLQSLNDNNNNNVPNSPSSSSLIQTQTSSPNKQQQLANFVSSSSLPHENSSSFTSQSENPTNPKNPCVSTQILAPQDPNSFTNNHSNPPPLSSIQKLPPNPKTRDKELDDLGKRWPRDEVLALVNVRCSLYNNGGGGGGGDQDQSGGGVDESASLKAPLWERISQGMVQLGYNRSAKRCKEKWENINKYFRKTKDVNKKRSLDSRTCPYFHQLSTLYNNQAGGAGNYKHPENCPIVSSENHSDQSEILPNSS